MDKRIVVVLLAVLMLQGCASRGAAARVEPGNATVQGNYEELREKYESGDPDTSIRDVRHAYALTSYYTPYAGPTDLALRELTKLANTGEFEQCFKQVNELDRVAFPMLELHHYGWLCASESGKVEESLQHERLARAIFADIISAGDGKSQETAWLTISTTELYLVLAIQGLQPRGQALVQSNGRAYDLMTVVKGDAGDEEPRYFDITLQMSYGMDSLHEDGK